ncbi:MAG: acyl carrier protein [Chitinophagaceae bacterium]|nr:acyl carrier protein [Anaerolineae bacterium]
MFIHDTLRAFITSALMRDAQYPLKNDEGLISGGLIDSFSLVELQLFIEREFNVRLDDTELTAAKIDSVNDLAALIDAHSGDTRPV